MDLKLQILVNKSQITKLIFPHSAYLSEEQKQELDRRLELHRQNPNRGSSWEQVKQRLGFLGLTHKNEKSRVLARVQGYRV